MPLVLALNPGSNSLKFDLAEISQGQRYASQGKKLLSGSIDNIGRATTLELVQNGKSISSTQGKFDNFNQAADGILSALATPRNDGLPSLDSVDLIAEAKAK